MTNNSGELADMSVGLRELEEGLTAERHVSVRRSKKMPLIEMLAKSATMDFLFDFQGERNTLPEGMTKSQLFDAVQLSSGLKVTIDGETTELEPYGSFDEGNAMEILEDAKTHIEAALIDYDLALKDLGDKLK